MPYKIWVGDCPTCTPILEPALLKYRAFPNDCSFTKVYEASLSWLRGVAVSILRPYSSLSLSGNLDDVVNEGAHALGRAARRYLFFCDRCGDAFLYRRDLVTHARQEHYIRGAAALVTLGSFAQNNARLVMRRTARRLLNPDELSDSDGDLEVGVDHTLEGRLLVALLVQAAIKRMSSEAVELVKRILDSELPQELELTDTVIEAWEHLSDLRLYYSSPTTPTSGVQHVYS